MELPVHAPLEEGGARKSFTGSPGGDKGTPLTADHLQELCDPQVSIDDVALQLSSNLDAGLSTADADHRLKIYGVNELEKKGKMPLWVLFLSQFANLIIVILIVAAIVSIIVGELVEGVAVIVIILITVSLSTATEYSSGNALDALAQLTDPNTHVYRNGELKKIHTPELVPGDIIELSPGDLVPADVRILEAHSAKVNEMILTGESADVTKKENVSSSEANTKLTNINMVYSSTSVVEGRIKGIVMLTGMNTRVGSIAVLLSTAGGRNTEDQELSERGKIVRRMNGHNEFEVPEVSDDEYADSDEDEEKGIVEVHKEPSAGTGCASALERLTAKIESYQPKKTPLQEGK
jgi:magnesium-transporting ATPase (P-type)